MGKKYEPVPNDLRKQLIELIHNNNYSIAKAAQVVGIYYPTAKAINKVYVKENRTQKKAFRFRLKNIEKNFVVVRQKILVEKPAITLLSDGTSVDTSRYICGFKPIPKPTPQNKLDHRLALIKRKMMGCFQAQQKQHKNLEFNFQIYSEQIENNITESHKKLITRNKIHNEDVTKKIKERTASEQLKLLKNKIETIACLDNLFLNNPFSRLMRQDSFSTISSLYGSPQSSFTPVTTPMFNSPGSLASQTKMEKQQITLMHKLEQKLPEGIIKPVAQIKPFSLEQQTTAAQ